MIVSRPQDAADWLLLIIAIITVLSAAFQFLVPAQALAAAAISVSVEIIYLFRLSSLLSGLFGGMLLHSFLAGRQEPSVILWASLQKLLGSALVVLGLIDGTLAAAALLIAVYDTAAGLYLLWYLNNRLMQRS
jgi:hypothetical protein